ncbi:unnamed protein product [Linum trigynum]|uniref:Secreted protein n=1 Tax=Linum trigynum TaxID=586398 RepID=A0AAV2EWI2_9ROSI
MWSRWRVIPPCGPVVLLSCVTRLEQVLRVLHQSVTTILLPLDESTSDSHLGLHPVEMLVDDRSLVGRILLVKLELMVHELLVLRAELLELESHLLELLCEEVHRRARSHRQLLVLLARRWTSSQSSSSR